MKKSIVFIKLGGSVITNKDIPMSLQVGVLRRLVTEVKKSMQEMPDTHFVVGHGQGSFAHVPASEYRTKEGFINEESKMGMAIVLDSVMQLHQRVIHEFLRDDIAAVPLRMANTLVTKDHQAVDYDMTVLEHYLEKDLLPVTCGDVIVDQKKGCTIWSTEEILSFLAEKFDRKGWQVRGIYHVTDVPGVLDKEGQLVEELSHSRFNQLKDSFKKAKGFDVTGGMLLKAQESLKLVKQGISSYILSGLEHGNLYQALTGVDWKGTSVK